MPAKVHSYGPKDGYQLLLEKGVTGISFELYKQIIGEFNKRATEHILQGDKVYLGSRLGYLYIKKVKRKFKVDENGKILKPSVDFGATNKLKAANIDKVVYRTDSDYFKWSWKKSVASAVGKSVWKFQPTKGAGGTKTMLSNLLKNPINHLRFDYDDKK